MRYGALFIALSASLLWLAVVIGGAGLALLWPALGFTLVGVAYLARRPTMLGKRPDGTLAWWVCLPLLPYFVFTWAIWHAERLFSREACANEIVPGLWVGRRPFRHELPEGARVIVDMTAELPAAAAVRRRPGYVCIPVLDGTAIDGDALRDLVDRLRGEHGIYLHCASGHGRSATLAAALLLRRGLAANVNDAEAKLRQRRPGIRLHAAQRRALEAIMTRWKA